MFVDATFKPGQTAKILTMENKPHLLPAAPMHHNKIETYNRWNQQ